MSFSIAATIRRLLAPQHEVSISWFLWNRLIRDLRVRGQNSTRESGAFLLGYMEDKARRITDYVLYDDLDPHSLDTGIVRFDGRYFGDLWKLCEKRGLSVVADVHVHPRGEGQSDSDRDHPMISQAGHVALILPDFAQRSMGADRVGIYRYRGAKRWEAVAHDRRRDVLRIAIV
ncbi:MAG: hypothetical protein KF694_22295 [Mesorhizobium sp.]|nr:hypothetical protein [Mesorhizobium sp.]